MDTSEINDILSKYNCVMPWEKEFFEHVDLFSKIPLDKLIELISKEAKGIAELEEFYENMGTCVDGFTSGHHTDKYQMLAAAYTKKTGIDWTDENIENT